MKTIARVYDTCGQARAVGGAAELYCEAYYRNGGWTHFDPAAGPYKPGRVH